MLDTRLPAIQIRTVAGNDHGKENSQEIQFKPLSAGLGFHPFSNGLPYATAPQSASAPKAPAAAQSSPLATAQMQPLSTPASLPMSAGGGAVSAGRPQFRFPTKIAATATQTAAATQAKAPSAAQVELSKTVTPASQKWILSKRSAAYLIDTALNVSLCGTALSLGLTQQDVNPSVLFNTGLLFFFVLFLVVFNWAMIVAQEMAFQSSVGKHIFGLRIDAARPTLLLRSILFGISVGFFGLGLIWALFDDSRRCWHDIATQASPKQS